MLGDRYPGFAMSRYVDQSKAHDPAIALRIEPIHDRVDEHPFVPVVVEYDYSDAFAKLMLSFPDGCHGAAEVAEIQFRLLTEVEDDPDVRSAVQVGRRISHCLKT